MQNLATVDAASYAKAQANTEAFQSLLSVTQTPSGLIRKNLGQVTQAQLAAIQAGRQAVERMESMKKQLETQVAEAETLVILAVQDGRRVTPGLLTPNVERKTRWARISWKAAFKALCGELGAHFEARETVLHEEKVGRNTEYDALVIT